jgi:hypothetical protein
MMPTGCDTLTGVADDGGTRFEGWESESVSQWWQQV